MNRIKNKAAALVAQRPYHAVAVSALLLALTSSSGFVVAERATDRAGISPASVEFALTEPDGTGQTDGAEVQGSEPADPDLGQSAEPQPAESAPAEPQPTEPQPTQEAPAEPAPAEPAPAPAPPAAMTVDYQYQVQTNYYYCGPAATRIALTALGANPGQDAVAGRLGTTVFGTNSAHETTRVLNEMAGTDFYQTRTISGPRATPAEMDQLQADVVRAISSGHAVVANIAGTFDRHRRRLALVRRRTLRGHRRVRRRGPPGADRRPGQRRSLLVLDDHHRHGELDRHPGLLGLIRTPSRSDGQHISGASTGRWAHRCRVSSGRWRAFLPAGRACQRTWRASTPGCGRRVPGWLPDGFAGLQPRFGVGGARTGSRHPRGADEPAGVRDEDVGVALGGEVTQVAAAGAPAQLGEGVGDQQLVQDPSRLVRSRCST